MPKTKKPRPRKPESKKPRKRGPRRTAAWKPIDPNSAYGHGVFSALVAGPLVMPTEWLPYFLPPDSEAIDDLGARVQLIMEAYDNVARELMENRENFGDATLDAIRRDGGTNR